MIITSNLPDTFGKNHVFTAEDVIKIMKIANMQPASLDNKVKSDEDTETTFGDFVVDDGPSPEDVVEEQDRALRLMQYINKLSPREKIVILRRYGFDNKNPMTLDAIGKEFGLTRERIRQIETKAIRKLRGQMHSHGIHSKYDL